MSVARLNGCVGQYAMGLPIGTKDGGITPRLAHFAAFSGMYRQCIGHVLPNQKNRTRARQGPDKTETMPSHGADVRVESVSEREESRAPLTATKSHD